MAKPRWMITRKGRTLDGDELTIVEVYAPGENKEMVKRENRRWTHERKPIKRSRYAQELWGIGAGWKDDR